MSSKDRHVRTFGKFSLDTEKRILWCENQPVKLASKEVELLCALTMRSGEVLTKAELLDLIWEDSFVEESNLSRHVYMLRKMFKSFGVDNLIETVPRRGYRFVGEVDEPAEATEEFTIERHSISRTRIEALAGATGTESILMTRPIASVSVMAASAAVIAVALILVYGTWRGGSGSSSAAASSDIRSLAVLPFSRLDYDAESKELSIGLADILISRISNLKNITVRPLTAVNGIDDRDPVAAGQLLRVDAVLVGTIYRSGDRTRVNARMLKTEDGTTIWFGEFERPTIESMRMQSDLASRVAAALSQNLPSGERDALAKSFTENPDAFRLYQEARFEWNKRNMQSTAEASRLFRLAIDKDPDFALAYVGLAETVSTVNADEADVIIRKAIELDPDLAEAHAALGFIETFVRRNWAEAEKELKLAVDLNPNYAPAHHWYAELLAILGRNAEAKAAMNRALEIDPRSHNSLADLGQIYYFNREYKEAEEYCRRALELNPDFAFAQQYLSDIYLQTGEFEKAVDAELAAERINSRFAIDSKERMLRSESQLKEKRMIAERQGKEEFLKRLLSGSHDNVFHYYDARRYAALGDKEMTLDALESSVHGKAFHTAFVKVDPVFDPVRDEARYKLILQKLNLLDTYN